jgi:hypothetical protein
MVTTTYDVGNPEPGLGQAQTCGGIKLANGIPTPNPPLLDNSISYGNAYMFLTFFILQATELRPGDITFWNHLKNAQIASGDDEGADDTDQIISYLQNYYQ